MFCFARMRVEPAVWRVEDADAPDAAAGAVEVNNMGGDPVAVGCYLS